MLTREE